MLSPPCCLDAEVKGSAGVEDEEEEELAKRKEGSGDTGERTRGDGSPGSTEGVSEKTVVAAARSNAISRLETRRKNTEGEPEKERKRRTERED